MKQKHILLDPTLWALIAIVLLCLFFPSCLGCRAAMNGSPPPMVAVDSPTIQPQQQGGINIAYASAAVGGGGFLGLCAWLWSRRADRQSELDTDKEQNRFTLDFTKLLIGREHEDPKM